MNYFPCPDCDGFTDRFRQSCHKCRATFEAEWNPLDWPAPPTAAPRAPWFLRWLGGAR